VRGTTAIAISASDFALRRLAVEETGHPMISLPVRLQEFSRHRSNRGVEVRGEAHEMEPLHCGIQSRSALLRNLTLSLAGLAAEKFRGNGGTCQVAAGRAGVDFRL
jgi:hypothetical protein